MGLIYFVNVAKNLNTDKYSNLDAPDFKQYLRNSITNSLFLSPITDNEIHDIINSLDTNKSNDISPELLKALCDSFCPILTYLFNSCMLSGTFPDELKIARVIPLFKSGNGKLDVPIIGPFQFFPPFAKYLKSLSMLEFISFWRTITFYTAISLISEKRTQQSTQFKQLYILLQKR